MPTEMLAIGKSTLNLCLYHAMKTNIDHHFRFDRGLVINFLEFFHFRKYSLNYMSLFDLSFEATSQENALSMSSHHSIHRHQLINNNILHEEFSSSVQDQSLDFNHIDVDIEMNARQREDSMSSFSSDTSEMY